MDTPLPKTSKALLPREWMRAEGLTYEQLAEKLELSSATQARRYIQGIRIPKPDLQEKFRAISGGKLTPYSFNRAWSERQAKVFSQSDNTKAGAAAP